MYAQPSHPETREPRETREFKRPREVREAAAVFNPGYIASPAPAPPPSPSPAASSALQPPPQPAPHPSPPPNPAPAPGRVWWYVLYEELARRDDIIDALAERVDILERETARNRTPPCERRRYFE